MSDCDAVDVIMSGHHYTSTVEDTVAAAFNAGTDLDCGSFYSKHTQEALDKHTIVESDIDRALERTFNVLVRLGYFDPSELQIYRNFSNNDINTNESQQLALLSAQQSIVLLKNLDQSLPLNLDQLTSKTVALIGPSLNATVLMQSNYHGVAPFVISPLMGFNAITSSISYLLHY